MCQIWLAIVALCGLASCTRLVVGGDPHSDGRVPYDARIVDGGLTHDGAVLVDGADAARGDGALVDATTTLLDAAPVDGSVDASSCLRVVSAGPVTSCAGAYPYLVGGEFDCPGNVTALWPTATLLQYSCFGTSSGTVSLRCANQPVSRVETTLVAAAREVRLSCPLGGDVVGGGCRCAAGALTAASPIPFSTWLCACTQAGLHQAVVFCRTINPSPICTNGVGYGARSSSGTTTAQCLGSKELVLTAGCRMQSVPDPAVPYAGSVVLRTSQASGANGWRCNTSGAAESGSELYASVTCVPP